MSFDQNKILIEANFMFLFYLGKVPRTLVCNPTPVYQLYYWETIGHIGTNGSWEYFFQMEPLILAPDWLKRNFQSIRGHDKVGDIIWTPVFRWDLEILACNWLKQGRYYGVLIQICRSRYILLFPRP